MKKTNWKNRIHNTKGVTLLELTIVLALLTIVTTLIVSFSTLVSNQVKMDNARADFITAASDCKFALQTKFAEIDQAGEISVYYTDEPCVIYFKPENGDGKNFAVSSQYPDITDCELKGMTGHPEFIQILLHSDKTDQTISFLLTSHCGATFVKGTPTQGGGQS
jgi:hypothetical protein